MHVTWVLYDTIQSFFLSLYKKLLAEIGKGLVERTINLLEHFVHSINIVMVEKPCLAISLIFLERNSKGICHIDRLPVVLS